MLEQFSETVKLVIKHFPLSQHKFAKQAAAAAIAADEQGKFWSYHQELFKNFRNLDEKKTREIAVELGLDMKKFKKDVKSPAAERRIQLDMKDGRNKGVSYVPSVYVNGKLLNDRSVQGLTKAVITESEKKK